MESCVSVEQFEDMLVREGVMRQDEKTELDPIRGTTRSGALFRNFGGKKRRGKEYLYFVITIITK
jgi:hypothetical protein